jgi:hypothetical protein
MELSSDTAGAIKARETAEARRRAQLGAPRAVA